MSTNNSVEWHELFIHLLETDFCMSPSSDNLQHIPGSHTKLSQLLSLIAAFELGKQLVDAGMLCLFLRFKTFWAEGELEQSFQWLCKYLFNIFVHLIWYIEHYISHNLPPKIIDMWNMSLHSTESMEGGVSGMIIDEIGRTSRSRYPFASLFHSGME